MYLPFLRGKQFEMLALRELAQLPLDPSKISPIIEPLKLEIKNIETVIKAIPNIRINLIVNPMYGLIKTNHNIVTSSINQLHESGFLNVIPTYIINKDKDFDLLNKSITDNNYNNLGYSVIHLNQTSRTNEIKSLFDSTNLIFNIIDVNHLRSLRRSLRSKSMAYISDPFNKQRKNGDYLNNIDEVFSEEHLYFKEDGFQGYSDYLSIGSEYIDGGRLPYAVVIHLTYLDKQNKIIRIGHFVSDSNEDDSDTPGKFAEALAKLISFINEQDILETIAIKKFKEYYNNKSYPGLGVIKKLSIMHHIELIQSLL